LQLALNPDLIKTLGTMQEPLQKNYSEMINEAIEMYIAYQQVKIEEDRARQESEPLDFDEFYGDLDI
jgi:hypothetical protein